MIQSTTFYFTIPNIWNRIMKKSENKFKKQPTIAQPRPPAAKALPSGGCSVHWMRLK